MSPTNSLLYSKESISEGMSGEGRTTNGWILRASCLPCTSSGRAGLGGRCCHRLAEHGM